MVQRTCNNWCVLDGTQQQQQTLERAQRSRYWIFIVCSMSEPTSMPKTLFKLLWLNLMLPEHYIYRWEVFILCFVLSVLNYRQEYHKTFIRMARQWAFLHRVKRSGIGFTLRYLSDIKPGSLAVICWACPNPDLNLPDGWEEVEDKYRYVCILLRICTFSEILVLFRYLYMPVYCLDANFRLKSRLRQNERANPPIAPGSGYFVDPEAYKNFLKDYVSENDVSTSK